MTRQLTEPEARWSLVSWLTLVAAWLIFGRGFLFILDTIANGAVK